VCALLRQGPTQERGAVIGGLNGLAVRGGGRGGRSPVTLAISTGRTETVIDRVDEWLRRQTFGGLVDRQELKNLLKDLVADDAYWVRQVVVCGGFACTCVLFCGFAPP
jgi:hypothetical protein